MHPVSTENQFHSAILYKCWATTTSYTFSQTVFVEHFSLNHHRANFGGDRIAHFTFLAVSWLSEREIWGIVLLAPTPNDCSPGLHEGTTELGVDITLPRHINPNVLLPAVGENYVVFKLVCRDSFTRVKFEGIYHWVDSGVGTLRTYLAVYQGSRRLLQGQQYTLTIQAYAITPYDYQKFLMAPQSREVYAEKFGPGVPTELPFVSVVSFR